MSALRFISFFIVAILLCGFALFVQAGNAIEPLPSDISKKFTVDESGKQLTFVQSYLIPKKTGKFEITLPKTRSRATAFFGDFSANVNIKADLSIDGKLTSSFGPFGYNIKHILPKGEHNMILFITKNKGVKDFYLSNPDAEPTDEDIPHFVFDITFSTEQEDIDEIQEYLDSLDSQSFSQDY